MPKIFYLLMFLKIFGCDDNQQIVRESFNLPDSTTAELEEIFRVSELGDSYFFNSIESLHFMENGNIILQDYAPTELFEINTKVELISVIGRKGRGPGEFQQIQKTFLTEEDSLHVYEFNYNRHHVFSRSDNGNWDLKRDRSLPFKRGFVFRDRIPSQIYSLKNGELFGVFIESVDSTFIGNGYTEETRFSYLAPLDDNLEIIGGEKKTRKPVSTLLNIQQDQLRINSGNPNFYSAFYLFNSENENVYYFTNESNELFEITLDGESEPVGFLPFEKLPLNEAEVKAQFESSKQLPIDISDFIRVSLLTHQPYYKKAYLADDRIWIQLTRRDMNKPNWVITNLSGEIIHSFIGPDKIGIFRVFNNSLYVSESKESGEIQLVRYNLNSNK